MDFRRNAHQLWSDLLRHERFARTRLLLSPYCRSGHHRRPPYRGGDHERRRDRLVLSGALRCAKSAGGSARSRGRRLVADRSAGGETEAAALYRRERRAGNGSPPRPRTVHHHRLDEPVTPGRATGDDLPHIHRRARRFAHCPHSPSRLWPAGSASPPGHSRPGGDRRALSPASVASGQHSRQRHRDPNRQGREIMGGPVGRRRRHPFRNRVRTGAMAHRNARRLARAGPALLLRRTLQAAGPVIAARAAPARL